MDLMIDLQWFPARCFNIKRDRIQTGWAKPTAVCARGWCRQCCQHSSCRGATFSFALSKRCLGFAWVNAALSFPWFLLLSCCLLIWMNMQLWRGNVAVWCFPFFFLLWTNSGKLSLDVILSSSFLLPDLCDCVKVTGKCIFFSQIAWRASCFGLC